MKRSIVLLPILALVAALLLVGAAGSGHVAQAFDPSKAPENPGAAARRPRRLRTVAIGRREGDEQAQELHLEQERRLRTQGREQRQGQPELPQRHRLRPPGRGQAQNETSIAIDPLEEEPSRRELQRLSPRRRQLLRRLQPQRRQELERLDRPDVLHPRCALWRRRVEYWQARRRHVGRVRHQGQRLSVVPDVHAWRGDDAEPRPVERLLRVPLDGQRRRLVELPGSTRGPEPRRRTVRMRRSSTSS